MHRRGSLMIVLLAALLVSGGAFAGETGGGKQMMRKKDDCPLAGRRMMHGPMMGGPMMGMGGMPGCPLLGGPMGHPMMGHPMMGRCPAEPGVDVKVEKRDDGVAVTFTSEDAATVSRLQKRAEIFRLMRELAAEEAENADE